eukprot:CAMPEP_0204904804 /NCGR_PEP_ID=MMETSP1397-20131031/5067_1 /ASSEMBLY_ACC=CAM_ASM_000891 /TAXON_ID=49980 /ORGANISM="Climacostomum Climacostomum virens, Strain Stock W-24" /LENGTH=134 /DNA_ID=CAMNT_0052073623 /DNA_START=371 /DNA_END=772 /DNA_ORIENTATION=-
MKEISLAGKTREEVLVELSQSVTDKGSLQLIGTNLVVSGDGPKWRVAVDYLNNDLESLFEEQQPSSVFTRPSMLISGALSHHTTLLPKSAGSLESIYGKFLNDFRNVTIAGAGHMVHMEKPQETIEVIKAFLES